MIRSKRKNRSTILLFGLVIFCLGQTLKAGVLPPSQEYLSELSAELPSEVYYNEHLRSAPPTGPGGSESGGNAGTGTVPLGEGLIPLSMAGIAYIFYKKRNNQL